MNALRLLTAPLLSAAFSSLFGSTLLEARPNDGSLPKTVIKTLAERSNYTETPRYQETLEHFEALAEGSTRSRVLEFGVTPQGRKQFAFVIASNGEFTPERARASGKPILFIQACIHAGENEGKDTLMALSRDWLYGKLQTAELDKVILLMVPIFNVDGHERFSPHNRINQNGPNAMGYRSTAQNYNLNRDYIKVESPEMQAWHRLWNSWSPSLLMDMHNTNGADYQYQLLLHYENHVGVSAAIREWQSVWNSVSAATEKRGHLLGPYLDMKVPDHLKGGLVNSFSLPRFSSGFGVAANRPALLLETHMLKDFKTRVAVNRSFLQETISAIAKDPQALIDATKAADQQAQARAGSEFPIHFSIAEKTQMFAFKGYAYQRVLSEVSGGLWTQYDTRKPETWQIPLQNHIEVAKTITLPDAYLVPAHWLSAIEKLRIHGVEMQPIQKAIELSDANTYRFEKVSYQPAPFEGQIRLAELHLSTITRPLEFPAASMIVRVNQKNSGKLIQLLEPEAPDSLVRDGYGAFFLTRAEYAEPRVMERKARALMQSNPEVKAEFEAKLASDSAFAASSSARLDFFYRKLPYYDQRFMIYPVARLSKAQLQTLTAP